MERIIPLNERERVQERRRDRERDMCTLGRGGGKEEGGGVECRERETNSAEMTKIFTNETKIKT